MGVGGKEKRSTKVVRKNYIKIVSKAPYICTGNEILRILRYKLHFVGQ
jgi:hypothetical protein